MADNEVEQVAEGVKELEVNDDLELTLDLGKKKKKKKKELVLDLDDAEAAAAPAAPAAEADDGMEMSLDLDLSKKKKKKKKNRQEEADFEEGEEGAVGPADDGQEKSVGKFPWSGSDREYDYEELLERVFGILRERNPELTGERRRTVLKPPQVAREGTKKTVFTNFMDLCKAMNRQHEHVSQYLLAELGTSGNLDGQQRLIVKGRFLPKSFETVLRRYVNEYVLCPGCKSVDTLLDKDSATRLMHLRCQQCGASRTVQAIKAGFVARVTKRVADAK
ncbi:eukaryotic translation initiation factor 2 beta [Volvox carteri f. nagariensis]|uniref:Eukaryotic translation initiation factor 2 subunit beta n=1 Tax=Volvox carteri f. nagariensis TaxID=3068 RepID=D8TMA5_VOLCA|nr:eukaryotic translation initiation factor 2 beta [Volvox carteri f. nagariensis]EFJ51608.1 eukaryotic translation initiation factor 2 beta [Volvox carteri f. nagariensis]|eukprot:XP_002947560.1 eukaryotic translation initiation factor 2 beta [Volvox carteri f. nagariensis]